ITSTSATRTMTTLRTLRRRRARGGSLDVQAGLATRLATLAAGAARLAGAQRISCFVVSAPAVDLTLTAGERSAILWLRFLSSRQSKELPTHGQDHRHRP